jgi:hypothetical protein
MVIFNSELGSHYQRVPPNAESAEKQKTPRAYEDFLQSYDVYTHATDQELEDAYGQVWKRRGWMGSSG